ncbi:MAG: PLP-dependent aminotransferase family protein [Erysipelothrix sp.]
MLKYEKIAHDLKNKILNGEILPGERFNSIRSLSEEYDCSKGTVIKAFDILRYEHIVYSKANSGFYVADDLLRDEDEDGDVLDLGTGNPTVDTFSIIEAKHVLNIAVDLYRNNSLESDVRGMMSLNQLMIDHLENYDIYCKTDNFFLTQGVIQTVSVLSRMTFPNGKNKVLLESPTYSFCNEMMRSLGMDVITINRDEQGINLKELENIFQNEPIKFFYVVPRNHNPLGTALSHHQRKEIVRLAHLYDVYIVEDDYFNDSFTIPKYSPLYYFSEFKNCIYMKSYSKLFPYIRIGYVVVPDALTEAFSNAADENYFLSYHMPDLVSQATLEAAIRSDILVTNAQSVSDSLTQKLKIVRDVTRDWNPDIARHIGGDCGYYSTIKLSNQINVEKLIEECEKKSMIISSNKMAFYHEEDYDNSIRISMSRIKIKQVSKALSFLYEIIKNEYETSL